MTAQVSSSCAGLTSGEVFIALQKDGWKITHAPYQLRYGVADVYIYLAASEAIAAEKEGRKIAVEVKSFVGGSTISEFHTALGQFLNYRIAIEVSSEPERILYLAVPTDTYQMFLRFEPAKTVIERYEIRLIIYNATREAIDQWID
ncbi:XisH family protein [Microcoleus sp. D3_18a_C4]